MFAVGAILHNDCLLCVLRRGCSGKGMEAPLAIIKLVSYLGVKCSSTTTTELHYLELYMGATVLKWSEPSTPQKLL